MQNDADEGVESEITDCQSQDSFRPRAHSWEKLSPNSYRLIVKRESGTVVISSKGVPIIVAPPLSSRMPKKQQRTESQGCRRDNCRLIGFWVKEQINCTDMEKHLKTVHEGLIVLEDVLDVS